MGLEIRNRDIEDSMERIFDDVEAFLGRWMNRFGGVLEQFRTLAEREQDLASREVTLEQSKSDFKQQRQRWAAQRDDELALLQQQVEELTEAWLRLENEQRVSPTVTPSTASAPPVEEVRKPFKPGEMGPQSPSILPQPSGVKSSPAPVTTSQGAPPSGSSSPGTTPLGVSSPGHLPPGPLIPGPKPEGEGQPLTRSSHTTPAPIPAALKSRSIQVQGSHHDPGRPATISQTGNGQAGEAHRPAAANAPTTRESSLEQFQQLQREVGLNLRPSS